MIIVAGAWILAAAIEPAKSQEIGLERDLLNLARRHLGELGTVQILGDTTDRRLDILAKYDSEEPAPEVIYGCYYAGPHVQQDFLPDLSCTAGSSTAVRQGLALEAEGYYADAVDIILRSRLDRGNTLVQITDWDLLHAVGLDEENAALAEYARVYHLLHQKGVDEQSLRRMFAPDAPVALPIFMPNPLAAEGTAAAPVHVDAAVELDKYGRSRRVRILDTSDDAARSDEKHVEHVIWKHRFRPRILDGRAAEGERVVIRYRAND